jgi:hypothetical protein
MGMAEPVDWAGVSGFYQYFFVNMQQPQTIVREPGNYMFVRPTDHGFVPVYIGVADDLGQRLTHHELWPIAHRYQAEYVMVHINQDQGEREREERDLIARWNPPCNTRLQTIPMGRALG